GESRGQPTLAPEPLAEALAFELLHRDVREPFVDAVVQDLDDVMTPERGRGARLAHETGRDGGIVRVSGDDELDRDFRAEVEMLGAPYRPHAALAEAVI